MSIKARAAKTALLLLAALSIGTGAFVYGVVSAHRKTRAHELAVRLILADLEQAKVTWAASGLWKYQHEAQLLRNGNAAVRQPRQPGQVPGDRVRSADPGDRLVLQGQPAEAFYSRESGTLQRLANGNTLITESERGRVSEGPPPARSSGST